MVQRSLAVAAPRVSAARLLAERIGAVALPPPTSVRPRPLCRPGLGPDVVCIVTGDAIGPVLAHLRAGNGPARLLWVANSPRATHGDALVDELLAAPCRPTVWDTARLGEPDLLRLAYATYRSAGAAAAIVCASDRRRHARQLIRALTSRGVPAHAASRWSRKVV